MNSNISYNKCGTHVGYIVLWYPLFTQPFIFREVEGLKALGLPITVYSLYGRHLRQCSQEMIDVAKETYTHGVRMAIFFLYEYFRQLFLHPKKVFNLMRRLLFHRWPSLEVFGENVWGFVAGAYFARLLVEDGIDVIHAPWPRGATTAALVASELSGIPFSTSARGDNLEPADPDLLEKLRAAQFIRANNRADMVRMGAMLPAEYTSKIHLVYNSLTLNVLSACSVRMQSPIRLLAVGRFDVTKGFEYLVEACHMLKEQGFAFRLTLAGGGGRSLGLGHVGPQLEKMCQNWGLGDAVYMPGLITHQHLPQLFLENDIFVAPCIIHKSGRRDGIPNTIIEALAYGMPVISSNINAIPEVVRHGETGWLVEQKNARALADAVCYLSEHAKTAQQLGENGRKLITEMFDPARNTQALAALFVSQYTLWQGKKICVE